MGTVEEKGQKISFDNKLSIWLNKKSSLGKIWKINCTCSMLIIIFFGLVLGFVSYFLGKYDKSSSDSVNYSILYYSFDLFKAIEILSILAFSLFGFSYLYMFACFFAGINNVHKSKSVHYIFLVTFIIIFSIAIAVAVLLAIIYLPWDWNAQMNMFS